MNEFFRKQNEDEKRDFEDIASKRVDAKNLFLKELSFKRLEALKNKIPFFKKAAIDDFEEYYEEQKKITLKKYGFVNFAVIKPININWEKYSSPANIELMEITEIFDNELSKRNNFDVHLKCFRYKYKEYGLPGEHNLSVMEDATDAVKRARCNYNNKEYKDVTNAEKVSIRYTKDGKIKGQNSNKGSK